MELPLENRTSIMKTRRSGARASIEKPTLYHLGPDYMGLAVTTHVTQVPEFRCLLYRILLVQQLVSTKVL